MPIHGFALRASPAVKHGVSPQGTVSEYATLLRGVGVISTTAENLSLSSNAIRIFMIAQILK